MTILQAIILGIVQGATEFLPISSSAHLVLLPAYLGWEFEHELAFAFDVLVQLGTIIAVIVYFWRDLWRITVAVLHGLWQRAPLTDPYARLGWLLVLATIPVVVAGAAFKDFFKSLFDNPTGVSALLLVTATLLLISERLSRRRSRTLTSVGWADALIMGSLQALAIFPGISRSGATIAGGLFRGLDRPTAARFSFLMAVPAMIGAGLVAVRDLFAIHGAADYLPVIAIGFLTSNVVGFLSIRWLLGYLQRRTLDGFALYCTLLGLAGLLTACAPASGVETAGPVATVPVGATHATLPLLQDWAARYPGEIAVQAEVYPSNQRLLDALQTSEVAAAVSLHAPDDGDLFTVPLATTALAAVAHPSNSVTGVNHDQLQGLFAGHIADWTAVGGRQTAVVVVMLDESSDVRQAFNALALANARPTPDAILAPDAAAVLEYVAETPGAIGYAPLAAVGDAPVRVLRIDGASPNDARYPLSATVLGITPEEPHGALRAWLAWAQTEGPAMLPMGFGALP